MSRSVLAGWAVVAALLATTACTAATSTGAPPSAPAADTSTTDTASPGAAPAQTADDGADDSTDVPVVKATPPPVTAVVRPTRVALASLDLALPVVPVGVADDGSMELPSSVREVGWYRFGPTPVGRAGTTVLAAHVDSRAEGVGPFVALQDAKKGARVTLELADGDRQTYAIASVRSYPKQQVPLDSVFARTGSPRLVLITCGGPYDRSHGGYRDNVVVEADLV